MPSPIAHAAMGYVIYRIYQPHLPQKGSRHVGPLPLLLMVTVGLSLLPDLDAVPGVLFGDLRRFHNSVMHSLVFGLVVAIPIAIVVWLRKPSGFVHWFIIALLCYEAHVIMDFFTLGRGVMALWPFSWDRYQSPVYLFYGLHWSEGWISVRHLWTLMTEVGFVVFVGLIVHVLSRRKLLRGQA